MAIYTQNFRNNIYKAQEEALNKKTCYIPKEYKTKFSSPCDKNNIIKAHSVSECLGLHHIMDEKKEVYEIPRLHAHSLHKNNGNYVIESVHINNASTQRMFCGHHDAEIFKPAETPPFIPNQEVCFLLAYRSVCLNIFLEDTENGIVGEDKKNKISILKKNLIQS